MQFTGNSGILGTLAATDPSAAALYVDRLRGTEDVGGLGSAVVTPRAVKAPAEAATWVATQEDGKGKSDAMGRVMWNWTTSDPVQASTWLVDQPAGPSRDAGIAGLSKAASPSDPEGAVTWAADISNEAFRNTAVGIGLREWQKTNPAAASAWAGQRGVPLPQAK